MLSEGILELGKNISFYRIRYTYSADVKPTENKTQFEFIYCMHLRMLSLCVYFDLYDTSCQHARQVFTTETITEFIPIQC